MCCRCLRVAFVVLLGALAAGGTSRLVLARTWTDKKGKQFEAELVEVNGTSAQFKLANGKSIKKPVAALSDEDQEFLKQAAEMPAEFEPTPKKPPAKKALKKKPASDDTAPSLPAVPARSGESGKAARTTAEGVTVEILGISLAKPLPTREEDDEQSSPFMMSVGQGRSGTLLAVMLSDPEREIITVDDERSKITACADDLGNDLTEGSFAGHVGFSRMPLMVRKGRHLALTEIDLPLLPAAGAAKIRLRGELAIRCGTGEAAAEQADVPLKSAGKITAGPVPLEIGPAKKDEGLQIDFFGLQPAGNAEESQPKMNVTLTSRKNTDAIKKIVFLTADGKEIGQRQLGSSNSTSLAPNGGSPMEHHSRTIGLAADLEKATVRIVAYEKLETIVVPIDFEIGVGF